MIIKYLNDYKIIIEGYLVDYKFLIILCRSLKEEEERTAKKGKP